MPRILYWNIDNFSANKLNDQRILNYIRTVLSTHPPHIIVIVEVSAPNAAGILDGVLLTGQGANGVIQLLTHLKNWTNNNNWCLVPPLTLGNEGVREGVAVYFDSRQLEFTGPYWWTDHFDGPRNPISRSVPPGTVNNINVYGGIWSETGVLPQRDVDPRSLYNPNFPQNQLAAQFQYFNNQGEIFFPTGGGPPPRSRAPFLTTFYEPNTNRNIKLFSIHTSPKTARQAVAALRTVREILNVNDLEVSVIVGDFNVDSFTRFNTYNSLLNNGYRMHLDPRDNNQNIDVSRQPYCMTHLLSVPNPIGTPQKATPYLESDPPGLSPHNQQGIPQQGLNSPGSLYPSYGYMGSMAPPDFQRVTFAASIDNIFTRYGNNTNPPQIHNTTIINPVVGSPYRVGQGYRFPQWLNNPVPGGLPRPANPANPDPNLIQFHQPENYGHIRRTSDHLPIIIDV